METGGESAHKLHVIFLYPHHRPAEENLWGEGSSGGQGQGERPAPALVAGFSWGCSAPQLRGDRARRQQVWGPFRDWGSLGLTAGGGEDYGRCEAPACIRSWRVLKSPSWEPAGAGVSRPCPEELFLTPRIPSRVNFRTSGPMGRWERVNCYLLTRAANDGGRKERGKGRANDQNNFRVSRK